jgi:hypothetical protein
MKFEWNWENQQRQSQRDKFVSHIRSNDTSCRNK